jgi:C-terminal processing protease CtpA/Prc
LAERGVENLAAFTRLLGYIRYFHPSDQAAAADWAQIAIAGVQRTEGAADSEALARVLREVFQPVAPTLQVFPTAAPPPRPSVSRPSIPKARAVAWKHYGVGVAGTDPMAPPSLYSSRRVDDQGGEEPAVLPRPEDLFEADLGGGVSARFPLAVWADDRGTLPAVPEGAVPPAPDKPAGFYPNGNDRATRLADVALAWNVFQHFYPYFDVVETDWPGALRQALRTAATDPSQTAFLATLDRLGAALHDGHVRVSPARRPIQRQLPILWELVEGRLTVIEAGPQATGVTRGSIVLKIGGRPAEEVLKEAAARVSAATPQWRDYRASGDLLSGKSGERVRLDLLSPGGKTGSVELMRSVAAGGMPKARPEKIAELRPGILYVDLDRMTEESLAAAQVRLAQARGLVLDLRGYPRFSVSSLLSHLTDSPLRSAFWDVPVPTRPDREGMAFDRSSSSIEPAAPRFKARIAFLTDGRAISAAETLLGIVEAYKLGEIVGGPTAGTNGNVNFLSLPGGFSMSWTGMRVVKHDGSRHHGVGIQPTVPVSRTLRGVAEGRDEVLEKGIEIVSR